MLSGLFHCRPAAAPTPVIWKDHLFLNVAAEGKIALWAVDRRSGKVLWQRHLSDGDRMQRKHNMSSPTPVTDGEWVWALTGTAFEGLRLSGQ